jgi:hypothetical protein
VKYAPTASRSQSASSTRPAISIVSGQRSVAALSGLDRRNRGSRSTSSPSFGRPTAGISTPAATTAARGLNPLYRWPDAGRGRPERIPLTQNRIIEIQQMPGGNISFAAEDPGLGIVAPDGKVIAYRGPDIVNFSTDRAGLHVSTDGAVISYPLTPDGRPAIRSTRSAAAIRRRRTRRSRRCFRLG